MVIQKNSSSMEDNRLNEYKILSKDEIINILENTPCYDHCVPMLLMMIVYSKSYDPENFSQEIHDTEEDKRQEDFDRMLNRIKEPDFDWVWNNDLDKLEKQNSQKWLENEAKNTPLEIASAFISSRNVNGKWTFNHENNINNITKHNDIVKLQLPTQEMVNDRNKEFAYYQQNYEIL
jgi:hypothetical protein